MGGEIDRMTAAEAANALGWWLEAGVDVAIAEQPRNWLAPAPPTASRPVAAPAPEPEAVPETLALFRDWLSSADRLPLAQAGAKRVLPSGDEGAPVMLIAEMPGREDASDGRPIGGEAWQLVERMLAAIGISADEAYSASLSCFHAPGARLAGKDLAACAEIARRHIGLAKPKRLLLFGDAPSMALLGKPMAAARGHVHQIEGVRTIVTFHPRFLMKQPSNKPLAWRDLLLLMEEDI